MQPVAPNLWRLQYPLRLLGMSIGRNVTLLRLTSDELVIHSTAPFTSEDVQSIHALGEPKWLVDATRFHDSFARAGREAFPKITYLAPAVFPQRAKLKIEALGAPPAEWKGEIELQLIEGMPRVQEQAMFHAPSRTLIVADLLFNFGAAASGWTKFVARYLLRLPDLVGMSPFFRLMIRDRNAFRRSIEKILAWDFEQVIVGHGEIIQTGGRQRIEELLSRR